jgi:hypothetical protein
MQVKADVEKQALFLTQQIMERWYALDLDPVNAALDENASWIGAAAGQFYMGKRTVLDALQAVCGSLVPCVVSDQTYEVADSGADWCVVAGNIVVTLKTDDMLLREPQRLTFLWRQRAGELRLSHMHVSNNAAVVAPDEEFPIKASRAAYAYLSSHISKNAVTVLASDRALYRIERETVRYLSAANEYMVIHTLSDEIRVHRRLTAVQRELFPEFLVLHRSCCANPSFLRTLRQTEAELTDGTRLPVSRERYAALCEQLNNQ